jgi:hypothetical protein
VGSLYGCRADELGEADEDTRSAGGVHLLAARVMVVPPAPTRSTYLTLDLPWLTAVGFP